MKVWSTKHLIRSGDNLKTKTPPITVYLSQHFPIFILQSKRPIPKARIFNHSKLLIPADDMI